MLSTPSCVKRWAKVLKQAHREAAAKGITAAWLVPSLTTRYSPLLPSTGKMPLAPDGVPSFRHSQLAPRNFILTSH